MSDPLSLSTVKVELTDKAHSFSTAEPNNYSLKNLSNILTQLKAERSASGTTCTGYTAADYTTTNASINGYKTPVANIPDFVCSCDSEIPGCTADGLVCDCVSDPDTCTCHTQCNAEVLGCTATGINCLCDDRGATGCQTNSVQSCTCNTKACTCNTESVCTTYVASCTTEGYSCSCNTDGGCGSDMWCSCESENCPDESLCICQAEYGSTCGCNLDNGCGTNEECTCNSRSCTCNTESVCTTYVIGCGSEISCTCNTDCSNYIASCTDYGLSCECNPRVTTCTCRYEDIGYHIGCACENYDCTCNSLDSVCPCNAKFSV